MVSLEQVKITRVRNFAQYGKFVDPHRFSQIKSLAKRLKYVRITVVSGTPYGGGVAEIWHSLVPIFQSLGLDIAWYSIAAPKEFFEITKKIHNLLQGATGKLTEAEQKLYLSVNKKVAKDLIQIPTDILLVHDPQPAAIVKFLPKPKPVTIWRCHIDTSNPNRLAWMFLKELISEYNHLIFTLPSYVHNEILNGTDDINRMADGREKTNYKNLPNLSFFQPTIDPFDEKLKMLTRSEAWKILSQFGLQKDRPLIFSPSRFDPWKDLLGTFEVYLLVKKHLPNTQIIFTGPLALDDPEGVTVRKKLIKKIKKTKEVKLGQDVFVYSNQDAFSYQQLAAAYSVSSVVIQKSLAEGFGLTVAEASYFAKPVIGGAVGGIVYQISDYSANPGKATGVLVDVTQEDRGIADTAFWTELLLKDKSLGKILGKRAKRRVVKNFLHPHAIFNYLNLFDKLMAEKEIKKTQHQPAISTANSI